jgi:hypothetical protein
MSLRGDEAHPTGHFEKRSDEAISSMSAGYAKDVLLSEFCEIATPGFAGLAMTVRVCLCEWL